MQEWIRSVSVGALIARVAVSVVLLGVLGLVLGWWQWPSTADQLAADVPSPSVSLVSGAQEGEACESPLGISIAPDGSGLICSDRASDGSELPSRVWRKAVDSFTTTDVSVSVTTTTMLSATTLPTANSGSVVVTDEVLFQVALRLWFESEEDSPIDRFFAAYDNAADAEADLTVLGLRSCSILETAQSDGLGARDAVAYLVSLMSSDDKELFDLQYAVLDSSVNYLCSDILEWYSAGAEEYVADDG